MNIYKEAVMGLPNRDEVDGKLDQAKGTIKENVGRVINDRDLEQEGQADRAGGKIEECRLQADRHKRPHLIERGYDSVRVNFRGIFDEHGRAMVLMTHNTDIADAWEREAEDPRFFYLFSPNGYAVGINILLYSLSH